MSERQPQCAECNHPKSFHPDGEWCCATGCNCSAWVEPKPKKAKTKAASAR
jgi:hypothetical protein